ncbi:MAG: hypothetical protein O2910_03230 [Proteobacteria bacterium]|nr:hypothetical protein [Pseudomonadota bacterium]
MRRFIRRSALILGLFLAVSFLGGSAVWHVLGPPDDLMVVNMSNAAHLVTAIPAADVGEVKDRSHDAEIGFQAGAPYGIRRDLFMSPLGLPCTPPT